jgi:hypothetical protein
MATQTLLKGDFPPNSSMVSKSSPSFIGVFSFALFLFVFGEEICWHFEPGLSMGGCAQVHLRLQWVRHVERGRIMHLDVNLEGLGFSVVG